MLTRELQQTQTDLAFQRAMLMEAAYWRGPEDRPTLDEMMANPDLSKLVSDWGRDGDAGIVAKDDAGVLTGCAWYRLWSDTEHSYGFVNEAVPELAIGVSREHRGQGIGSALVKALLAHASSTGIHQVSLSVEKDNPALRLYEQHGFSSVSENGNAWTMVVDVV